MPSVHLTIAGTLLAGLCLAPAADSQERRLGPIGTLQGSQPSQQAKRLQMAAEQPSVVSVGAQAAAAGADELLMHDFEQGTEEWIIPDWAAQSPDYGGRSITVANDFVSHGRRSLQLLAEFPGLRWRGAYVERLVQVTDWSRYGAIAVDIFIPYNAPQDLMARFVLTIGKDWTWTEMNRGLPLAPDRWTTIRANLKPGSMDWKYFPDDSFRTDIRKLGIRIESEGKAYSGPVYIDHVRLLP